MTRRFAQRLARFVARIISSADAPLLKPCDRSSMQETPNIDEARRGGAARVDSGPQRLHSNLQRKQTIVMSALVALSILVPGLTEMLFGYREAIAQVERAQAAQAQEVANAIKGTLGMVERQLGLVTILPWEVPGWLGSAERRDEYLRLLRVAPSVSAVRHIDSSGNEQLSVSRRETDRTTTHSVAVPNAKPAANCTRCGYAPVVYEQGYEPMLLLTITSQESGSGRTEAQLNLRALAAELAVALKPPDSDAMVVDAAGTIVLHSTQSYMLEQRRIDQALHTALVAADLHAVSGIGLTGEPVIASSLALPSLRWWVVILQPRTAALAPVRNTLVRTGAFLLGGLALAVVAASFLARRMTRPVLALHDGATALGRGELGARVQVRTGDELEEVAAQFNRMADNLQENVAHLEERVAEKTRDLEIANRHKSEFLANMSHELRTPLNAVIGFSEALQEEMFGPLNAKQHEYVDDIHASGAHLLALINDVLDLAKIEAGHLELERSEFDVRAALQQAATLLRERCQRQGVTLQLNIAEAINVWFADERRFKQVVVNLLTNAVKFTPSGGRVTLTAGVADDEGLWVEVGDTGVGIAPEHHELVFQEFRQVGGGGLRKAEGTGLGLALVRRLVEQHGGRVGVRSQRGEGAVFRFNIPQGIE